MVSEEVLRQATERLVARFHPDRIILFGSQARGTADKHSDVDLLVILPIRGNRWDLMVEMDRALDDVRMPSEVVVLSPEEFERDRHIPGTIARPACREGKVLYERFES